MLTAPRKIEYPVVGVEVFHQKTTLIASSAGTYIRLLLYHHHYLQISLDLLEGLN